MADKDQTIGGLICTTCVGIAMAYTTAPFWPTLEGIRLWLVAIPVLVAFLAIPSHWYLDRLDHGHNLAAQTNRRPRTGRHDRRPKEEKKE